MKISEFHGSELFPVILLPGILIFRKSFERERYTRTGTLKTIKLKNSEPF